MPSRTCLNILISVERGLAEATKLEYGVNMLYAPCSGSDIYEDELNICSMQHNNICRINRKT